MREVVCNYAIARFRPYRETGEFVNVGVVLVCPEAGCFDYLFEMGDCQRVTSFFPRLDVKVFSAGRDGLLKELARVTTREREEHSAPTALREGASGSLARFRELVRPREALFIFSEVRTVLAVDPRAKLEEIFHFCTQRQPAPDPFAGLAHEIDRPLHQPSTINHQPP
ncbi:MAG TPA: DUF3037 domain-containing protein [Verrucomicrobiota bacterium]|nr:DUF3037 domain-containing protein [Verrucomicrobiota bacterium]